MEKDIQIASESLRYSCDIPGQALRKDGARKSSSCGEARARSVRIDVRRFLERYRGSPLPLKTRGATSMVPKRRERRNRNGIHQTMKTGRARFGKVAAGVFSTTWRCPQVDAAPGAGGEVRVTHEWRSSATGVGSGRQWLARRGEGVWWMRTRRQQRAAREASHGLFAWRRRAELYTRSRNGPCMWKRSSSGRPRSSTAPGPVDCTGDDPMASFLSSTSRKVFAPRSSTSNSSGALQADRFGRSVGRLGTGQRDPHARRAGRRSSRSAQERATSQARVKRGGQGQARADQRPTTARRSPQALCLACGPWPPRSAAVLGNKIFPTAGGLYFVSRGMTALAPTTMPVVDRRLAQWYGCRVRERGSRSRPQRCEGSIRKRGAQVRAVVSAAQRSWPALPRIEVAPIVDRKCAVREQVERRLLTTGTGLRNVGCGRGLRPRINA